MRPVEWALKLRDNFAPVGQRIVATFGKIGAAAKRLGERGLKAASKGVDSLRKKVNEAAPKLAKWAALGLAGAAGGLAYAGKALAIDAQAFKDSTLLATKALLKSDALAGSAYKRMLDFAHFFGEDPTDAIQRFNKALADGFSARDAEKLLQAFGDLKLVTPDISPDSLLGAFGEIRKKGKLELGDFQSAVSAAGLNLTLAYEAIGKKIGKNAKQVEALIASGRVRSDVGLVGLLDAINQRTNSSQAGEKLAEYAKSTSGLVARLKNLPQQFILRMTADDSPIKGTLSRLLEQLDPNSPNGKKIIGALDSALKSIGETISTWATPEGIDKLTKGIGQVIEAAPKVIKAIGAVSSAVLVVVDAFSSFRDNVRFLWAEFKRGSALLAGLVTPVLGLINPFAAFGVAVYTAGKIVVGTVPKIVSAISGVAKDALKWGGEIANGLLKGVTDKWDALVAKIKSLAGQLPASVKKALGIASPSKVFAAEVGQHIPGGIGKGVVDAVPSMEAQIVHAIDTSRGAVASSVSNVSTSTSSTTNNTKTVTPTVSIGQVVFGDGDRGQRREQVRELVSALERAALANG